MTDTTACSAPAAVVIPAYQPDDRLIGFVAELAGLDLPIIVVDDGSSPSTRTVFERLPALPRLTVLTHAVNQGKGRALKTAFNHYLLAYPGGPGIVTADSDGQHSAQDIARCLQVLKQYPESLVLGVRDFFSAEVPPKSRYGNLASVGAFYLLAGVRISDTQTGLRGIPRRLMEFLLNCPGERFEFETRMLTEAHGRGFSFREVPIRTIYENGNRGTHFRPWKDSWKIYRVLFEQFLGQFFSFTANGIFSAALDLGLFTILFYAVLQQWAWRLMGAQIIARILSSTFNYLLNKVYAFGAKSRYLIEWKSFVRYWLLCLVVLAGASVLLELGTRFLPQVNTVAIKVAADLLLFCFSFFAQKLFVFNRRSAD